MSSAQHLSSCQGDIHPLSCGARHHKVWNNVEPSYDWLANDPQCCIKGVTLQPAAKYCRHGNKASEVPQETLGVGG